MKKSIVLIPLPSLIKNSFVRSFSLSAGLSVNVFILSLRVCLLMSSVFAGLSADVFVLSVRVCLLWSSFFLGGCIC